MARSFSRAIASGVSGVWCWVLGLGCGEKLLQTTIKHTLNFPKLNNL
ncbi:MAG: hypothetical protein QNJ68_06495 [Microcoleaceae cyanobacterium MO_207.B10]|nr:hypothetical protein [Microcoleaceae cyanobacterium MO_207.B10]